MVLYFNFFPGESLETQNEKKYQQKQNFNKWQHQNVHVNYFIQHVQIKKILRTLEPGIDSLIDRL